MATQAPLDKMLALFERPESEAALVRAGKVPRGWLYDVGGGLYFHSKICLLYTSPSPRDA